MDTDRSCLGSEDLAELERELLGSRRTECHHRWESSSAALRQHRRKRVDAPKPHSRPVFHVRCNEQWYARTHLKLVELGGVAERQSDRQDESADFILLDPFPDLLEFRGADRCIIAPDPRHHELAYFLAESERTERALDPALVGGREASGCPRGRWAEQSPGRGIDPGKDG